MAVCQRLESDFEIIKRVDAIHFAGLDQGCQHTPVFSAFVMSGEEGIFSIECDRADVVLHGIIVDLDAAMRM